MKDFEVKIHPGFEEDFNYIREKIKEKYKLSDQELVNLHITKRSLDARNKPYFNVKCSLEPETRRSFIKRNVNKSPEIHIIGAGPAGLFSALKSIELGFKPIIIERGKKVRERRKDLAILMKQGIINSDSNYCFGEGGAGTFSDGKLYTRSGKRGSIREVLEIFVEFGANPNILIEAHPHIGTNKLPQIINNITNTILECGGEVHFSSKLIDLKISDNLIQKIITKNAEYSVKKLILATGHSARDIFELLERKKIKLEPKSFALGVRIEHPQSVINKIQYKNSYNNPALPPASYSLVTQVKDRGVYSFCMCPGGIICPAATNDQEVVVNGWSPSRRNSFFANSGLVVEAPINEILKMPQDQFYFGENLSALNFQASVEKRAYQAGGGKFRAPAQRVVDFLKNKISDTLPKNSYKPGLTPSDLSLVLPKEINFRLVKALEFFIKKNPLYGSEESVLVGVESRTSSPVKIPRNEFCEHIEIKNLYPCGEGAGYAGGIVSAAMDGIKTSTLALKN